MMSTRTGPSIDGVEEVTLTARTIAGLRERVALPDLAGFFGRAIPDVIAEFARLGIVPAGPPTAVYRHERADKFDVTVGFPVAGELPATARLLADDLPAGRAVQVEHVGPYETLPDAYAALGAWFGAHRVQPPDVMWEEYLTGPGVTEESDFRTKVVYPVR